MGLSTVRGPGTVVPSARSALASYLDRLRRFPVWNEILGRILFLAGMFNITLLLLLAVLGDGGTAGIVVYLVFWIGVVLLLPVFLPRPLGTAGYLTAIVMLALLEEAAAYSVGGGLHGAALSLPDDWVRSVPTWVGLGAALRFSALRFGLSPEELIAAAAASGLFIELGPGGGSNPIAFAAFGGAIAWVYASLLVLPTAAAGPPAVPIRRALGTTAALVVGVLAGYVVVTMIEAASRLGA
jgi:hypothetical protein